MRPSHYFSVWQNGFVDTCVMAKEVVHLRAQRIQAFALFPSDQEAMHLHPGLPSETFKLRQD